ncbi:type II secretion system F family protein, partial [bacterium]|nr:type II secretion system F family protein [bacterium]
LTQFVMGLSEFIVKKGIFVAVIICYLLYELFKYRETEKGRLKVDGLLMKIPAFNKMIYYSDTIRFYKILSTLISSGMPIVTGCEIAKNALSNRSLIYRLNLISDFLRNGLGFSTSMAQIDLFPVRDIQMMKIGEESGKLDYVLSNLSESYFESMDALVSSAIVFIEVLFILLVGIFIAVIVVAMYLPMFAMWQQTGGG